MLLIRTSLSLLSRTMPMGMGSTAAGISSSARIYSPALSLIRTMATAAGEDMARDFKEPVMGNNPAAAMESLAKADAVCFDVDSTVVNEEGIDVLADFLGKGEQVAALTKKAMEGGMKFQDALASRLELLEPSKAQILACLKERPLVLTKGVQELVTKLQQSNKDVYLVSGGFRIMIEPVASTLQIPVENIYANTIVFEENGDYLAFDANEPTSQDMGKPKALRMIQERKNYHTMVMIGDGFTDSQAKPPAATFIGFGGVVVRQQVKDVADWFVEDFDDLIHIVEKYSSS